MNLRHRDRVVLGVLVVVGVIAAYWMLLLSPQRKQDTTLTASIAKEQQTLVEAEHNYAAGRAAAASLRTDDAQWAALGLAVPTQSNIPALLRTLDRDAHQVGVDLQTVALSNSSTAATTTPSSAGSATGVPVQLTFDGGYAALDRLVRRLNGMVVVSGNHVRATGPLMTISNVSVSDGTSLTVNLDATIYQLAAASGAAGASGGGS